MKFLVNLVIVLLVIPVNIKKIVLLLINSLMILKIFDFISNTTVCEDSSIVSLADDGGIELRNYDIVIIRFNF